MTGQRLVDIPAAASKDEVLDAFARSLAFPTYFGHNLDALADCLQDFADASKVPVTLIWHVDPAFKATRAYGLVLDILTEVARASASDSPQSAFTFMVREAPGKQAASKS